MNKIYQWMMGVGLLLGAYACQQLQVEEYTNDPRLYFYKGDYKLGDEIKKQGDSIAQSFFVKPDAQMIDTVYIELRTMGFPADHPRAFKVEQTNGGEADAAVAGKHYVGFDAAQAVEALYIPEGVVRYQMPVYILRNDPRLDTMKFHLKMKIVANENFGVGIDTLSRFLVTITARPDKPINWDSGRYSFAFGEWGAKKMWFIMKYVGVTDFTPTISDMSYAFYLQGYAKAKLEAYNRDENNPDRPLREADGTEVKF